VNRTKDPERLGSFCEAKHVAVVTGDPWKILDMAWIVCPNGKQIRSAVTYRIGYVDGKRGQSSRMRAYLSAIQPHGRIGVHAFEE
jgi:hypothetical protein